MATHSSIFAWEIPQTEETGRLQFMEREKLEQTSQIDTLFAALPQRQHSKGSVNTGRIQDSYMSQSSWDSPGFHLLS